jgi:NAD(P)-dependent dehydrogenase (short-subunit alcohol dehydrogenase family)
MTDFGVALVTGAGGGLGAAVAHRFAEAGGHVVCLDRDLDAASRTAAAVREAGGRAEAHGVDVTEEPQLAALRDRLRADGRAPRVLVNAAGILHRGQLAETDAATFRRVVDVNLTGAYLVTRTFAGELASSRRGRIVNIASIAGTIGYEFPAYAASKAGLINLTRSLLIDFWGMGVTVNAVCPGAMDTPMLDRSALPAFRRRTPAGRVVTPDEVAAVCAFLAGDDAACVNGQSIVVDGGATAVFRYRVEAGEEEAG